MNPEPIIPNPVSTPIVPVKPVKKDKVSKVLKISIVVVLLTVICLGTFWGGMYYSQNHSSASKTAQNDVKVTTTPTPTPTATPVPTRQDLKDLVQALPTATPSAKPTVTPVNPYKDWKTYTSPDMKLSFKYKTLNQINYNQATGTLEARGDGYSVLFNLYHYSRISELNATKANDDPTYINPKSGFDFMGEVYSNLATVKVGNNSYTMRHLLYGDGPMNADPTKCDASVNGTEKYYTEVFKSNKFEGDPIGIELNFGLLVSNDLCNGQDAPIVKSQKLVLEEALKMVESITFN